MTSSLRVSRRRFVQSASMMTAGLAIPSRFFLEMQAGSPAQQPLEQFDYGDVVLASGLHEKQLEETHSVLMGLSDDNPRPARTWVVGITTIPTTSGAKTRTASLPAALLASGFRHSRAFMPSRETRLHVKK
jgi:hypothetical protein